MTKSKNATTIRVLDETCDECAGGRLADSACAKCLQRERDPRYQATIRKMLFRGIIVQIWAEPPLNLCQTHALAFAIIGDLITFDFAQIEISRFRVSEIESTHAGARPHREGLGNLHSGIRSHIEQPPERAFLRSGHAG
jgi:hypothetical protein